MANLLINYYIIIVPTFWRQQKLFPRSRPHRRPVKQSLIKTGFIYSIDYVVP